MKKSKLISGFMALAMAVSGMSFTAANAADVGVKVGSAVKNPGDSFEIAVDLSGVPSAGLSSVDFAVSFDSSLIDITDVTMGTIGNTGAASEEGSDLGKTVFNWNKANGQVIIVWSTGLTDSSKWIKSDGTLATISGKVNSSAANGSVADLKVVAVKRPDYPDGADNTTLVFSGVGESNTADYTASITNGKITIGTPTTESTTGPTPKIGDVDCNGEIKIADAVLLARYVAEDAVTVTAQGKVNANCYNDGSDAITSEDLASLLKYLAGISKSLPES